MAMWSVKLLGGDGKPLYLQSVNVRPDTVYATAFAFHSDNAFAAMFPSSCIQDVLDTMEHLTATPCSAVRASPKSHGVTYNSLD